MNIWLCRIRLRPTWVLMTAIQVEMIIPRVINRKCHLCKFPGRISRFDGLYRRPLQPWFLDITLMRGFALQTAAPSLQRRRARIPRMSAPRLRPTSFYIIYIILITISQNLLQKVSRNYRYRQDSRRSHATSTARSNVTINPAFHIS